MHGHDTHKSAEIVILPDAGKLKTEIEKLRTELSMLVLERDGLLYQECKNIEMMYLLSVGGLEYKVYEIECAILRLKRKAELIQAKRNRQEKASLAVIEAVLDAEFAEYQAKLNAQIDRMNAALERSHGEKLTDIEVREMKKLYRAVVKTLHPDLHPGQSDARIQLFHHAVEAYENGDLDELRIISEMVADLVLPEVAADGLAYLAKEKERLSNLIMRIQERISLIKSTYPYTMKDLVQSPEKIQARKDELEEEIRQLNELLGIYTARIAEMLR